MSRLRLVSFSKSAKRIALSRMRRAIWAVEQLPVCSRITLGGAPHVMLRLAKSLSFVRNVNPCAFAYFHMTESGVLPSSAELTWIEPGNRSARSAASSGARFSSTRSFKSRDPVWNTGEELVHRLEVFLLQVGEVLQNLFLGHSGCEVRCEIVDREAQATNAGLAPILPGSTVMRGFRPAMDLPPL